MDRSWMYSAPRCSEPFINGVQFFLNFAFERSNVNGKILCHCARCLNMYYRGRGDILDHLICFGFRSEYLVWVYHGEGSTTTSSGIVHNAEEDLFDHDMYEMLNDVFQPEIDVTRVETHEATLNSGQEVENEGRIFDNIVKEVEEKLYPSCKYNKLSSIVHLYHIKCLNGWSNKSFSMLLEFLKDLLPEGNLLPKTTPQVKKIMAKLGLGYEKIHSCPNGCMLFWEEKEKDECCSICGSSRWKVSQDNSENGTIPPKKKASKILRWFPLKPRLQRLFMSSKTASLMKWHHVERVEDGKIRHPADALAWKDFDKKFPEFASDPRNVRLTLASDGFNPFRTMNVSHSIWPVFLIPYNLPPWLVMKQPNFILSLIIPGPRAPGNKIDMYMQPLIKELKELWDVGVETFDASTKQNFQLKASVLSTISDFPGYANLSGWSTKGALACPLCGFDTDSKWLTHGKKYCYMYHRRWLPTNHHWRRDTKSFVGREELRVAPKPSSGEEVLQQLDGTEFLAEKVDGGPWKKKSHGKKSKDNYETRLDLKQLGIRKELHPKKRPRSDTTFMPRACYQMNRDEKGLFLKILKLIKPPDEFSSNISRCVQLNEKKLVGMKSYDHHMLMQEYLPIALRGTLPDHVSSTIIELSDFFRIICYKDLTEVDLQYLESKVSVTLCKLEKIFPPSFFTIMVHLVIHLVRDVKLGGPVAFRWMYPIERYLLTLKSYVHNRAHPEGSIAEGYLAQECVTFCSRYLSGVETIFTTPIRNDDEGDQNEIEESNNLFPGRPLGRKKNSRVARMEEQGDQKVTDEIKWLARGPLRVVQKYSGYLVKGYRFHTRKREELLRTQNSGVAVMVEGANYSSSRDRRLVEGVNNYYGKLTDIIELNYSGMIRVVLFKCEWVDINRGCKKDGNVTLVNFSYKTHTGVNLIDDPFVLASQADKVFYSMDPKHIGWEIVRHVKLRDVFDMGGAYDDIFDVPNLHRVGDDGIDVTPEMIIANENIDVIDDEENNSD
ncbi:uncharacterized protein LOC111897976 [Lactuca sativa]|uniref:uncharacterized protein LOC111897976 n=1 Tax=Lactuca sativa TaxID=4236 RepID=UPI0022AF0175|nr:uncharacterized protein LOC111897976 [Lactuca sativa]